MKTDIEIKQDVLAELAWQPEIDETQLGVIVEDGVVTLSGVVDSYVKKVAAEKAVKRLAGVRAVAEDIEIMYGNAYKKTDKEIAKAAADALEWNAIVPHEDIAIRVEDGRIFLEGKLKWAYQKEAAQKAVRNLLGVKAVNSNKLEILQEIQPSAVREKISEAFERSAEIEAKGIKIELEGNTVVLKGKVHSIKEKEDAERAAYNAPGVETVKNKLMVQFYPVRP